MLGPQCERRSRDPCRVLPAALAAAAFGHARRRSGCIPLVEIGAVARADRDRRGQLFRRHAPDAPAALLTPGAVAALLVANLVPAMALMVLVARRLAMRRAARSPIGGQGPAPRPPGRLVLGDRQRADPAGRDLRLVAVPERRRILVFGPRADGAAKTPRTSPQIYRDEHATGSSRETATMGERRRRRHQPVRHRQPAVRRELARPGLLPQPDRGGPDPRSTPQRRACRRWRWSISTSGRSSSAFRRRCCAQLRAGEPRDRRPTPATGSRRSSGSIPTAEIYLYVSRVVRTPTADRADRRGAAAPRATIRRRSNRSRDLQIPLQRGPAAASRC